MFRHTAVYRLTAGYRLWLTTWWAVLLGTLSVGAQDVPPIPDTLVTLRAQQVIVPFTVVDRLNRPVTNLVAEEVKLFEDGLEQDIVSLQPATSLPLTAAIVLDCSGSMIGRLSLAKRATGNFLTHLLHRPQDRAALLACQQDILLAHPLTGDITALRRVLADLDARLPTPLGQTPPFDPSTMTPPGTALYATIYAAIDLLLTDAGEDSRRRLVVVVSDGFDNEGIIHLREIIEHAWRSGVSIYALGIGAPDLTADTVNRTVNRAELERLCISTGGQAFFPRLDREFFTAFAQIEAELRQCFVLAYTPLHESAAFRTIRIEIPRHPDWKVRHRIGYYASAP